jgi:hypothetical protein
MNAAVEGHSPPSPADALIAAVLPLGENDLRDRTVSKQNDCKHPQELGEEVLMGSTESAPRQVAVIGNLGRHLGLGGVFRSRVDRVYARRPILVFVDDFDFRLLVFRHRDRAQNEVQERSSRSIDSIQE